jgi:hypothetical protein
MTEPRFFVDHGVIHDRATGKHVVTDGEWPFEDDLPRVLALLNGLSEKAVTILQHEERARDIALRLDQALGLVVASPEGADIYLGDLITMGCEISDLLREIGGLPALSRS